jgi:peptidoglycan/LPS O-acetylase OafA/YrhL
MAAAIGSRAQVAPQAERFYLPELDSLRFFAFLAVFSAHCCHLFKPVGWFVTIVSECGNFGVDLFFVLSAYLLTELLLRERDSSGEVDVRAFYVRRGLRIWPLYFTYLGGLFVFSRFRFGSHIPLADFGAFAIFMGNLACYLSAGVSLAIAPLWSVSLEEQFYAVLPWVIRATSRRGLAIFAAAIWLLSLGCRAWLFYGNAHASPSHIWYFPLARLDPIACGILISVTGIASLKMSAIRRTGLLPAGLVLWLLAGMMHPHSETIGMLGLLCSYTTAALGCGTVLLATIGCTNAFARNPCLIYLGRISYGLYVCHGGIATFAAHASVRLPRWFALSAGPLFALGLTVAVASASYRWLESPFLRLKRRFEFVRH